MFIFDAWIKSKESNMLFSMSTEQQNKNVLN